MPTVNTVSGPVDTADLGFTLMHEHIIVESPGVKENFPVVDRKAEIEKAAAKLKEAMARGVKTLVDLTPGDWRDIPFVKEVVARSGMQVIVATGIYWEVPHHFRARHRPSRSNTSPISSCAIFRKASWTPASRRRSSSARPMSRA